MNQNRNKPAIAPAETAMHPPKFPRRIPIGDTYMEFTASIRRQIRKLVAKGKVARSALPLELDVNNALFSWMRPLNVREVTGTYTGTPFNIGVLAPTPSIPATIVKVDTPTENKAAIKATKRAPAKRAPKVEATVTKVSKVNGPAKPKSTTKDGTKSKTAKAPAVKG